LKRPLLILNALMHRDGLFQPRLLPLRRNALDAEKLLEWIVL